MRLRPHGASNRAARRSPDRRRLTVLHPLDPYPFSAGGLGYNGALGGDGAFANIYDPAFHTLAGPRGYPYGYLAEEVGDNGFRAPGDLKDFFDIAAADFGESEVVAEAARKLGLKDHSKDKMPGLAITLMPHQIQGVAWMLAKEQDAKCKGGIMADDMVKSSSRPAPSPLLSTLTPALLCPHRRDSARRYRRLASWSRTEPRPMIASGQRLLSARLRSSISGGSKLRQSVRPTS